MRKFLIDLFQLFPYEYKIFRFILRPLVFIFKLNKKPIIVDFQGIKLKLYPSNSHHQTGIALYPRIIEKKMIGAIINKIKSKGIFIDLGSHSGFYALIIYSKSRKVQNSYAFEVDSTTSKIIKENIDINKLNKNVKVINRAVAGSIKSFTISKNKKNTGSNFVKLSNIGKKNKTIKLSGWFNRKICRKISAIKLDIEGHEPEVLRDLFENIKKIYWPDVIIVEINPQFKNSFKIKRILNKYNYFKIEKENQNYAFLKQF